MNFVLEHECAICFKEFTSEGNLLEHIKLYHPIHEKLFNCQVCDHQFEDQNTLKKHCESTHDVNESVNSNKTMPEKNNMKRQKATIYDGRKKFTCPDCDFKFKKLSTMKKHVFKIHHVKKPDGIKPFHCSMCDVKFASERFLKQLFPTNL